MDINSVLLAEMKDAFPVFGSISKIWMYQRFVFFALKVFVTVNFCANLNAYEIKEEELPSGLFVIEAQDLLMTNVMHIYKHNGLCLFALGKILTPSLSDPPPPPCYS